MRLNGHLEVSERFQRCREKVQTRAQAADCHRPVIYRRRTFL